MKTNVKNRRQLLGLYFGLSVGVGFALFAWGIDFVLLERAHGAYSWVKFIPGLFFSIVSGGLVGWVTSRLQNPLLRILLWLCFAYFLSKLFIWLPINAAPQVIGWFDSYLGNFLNYPMYTEFTYIQWVGFAVIALISVFCSLLENILIDQALFSTASFPYLFPILVGFVLFALAGGTVDSQYNKKIRQPIIVVDQLIQFAVDNADNEVSLEDRRSMHLSAINGVAELLPLERSLILSNYDQVLGQIDVLVNFNGQWVKCITIYNQVTDCKLVFDQPRNFLV